MSEERTYEEAKMSEEEIRKRENRQPPKPSPGSKQAKALAGNEPEEHPGAEATIGDIMAWVGDDSERAITAELLENEQDSPRSSLLSKLAAIIEAD